MAGQARRGERGTGRSSRAGSSWPLIAAASAVASGSDIVTTTAPAPASTSRASSPELHTRATYRNLILRGLAPDEAANLTAYLAGINVGETHWTLRQINQLLFLREMNRSGHFAESAEPPLH
jgi:NAD(P)H-hydrate repair Nnr-like enzyme with NAD(P)H-hydrate dehydratase domain